MLRKKARTGGRKTHNDLEHAVETLRLDIQQGRFIPGQRLVEVDLMQHLEVTRGRVREVFKRLESEDLIQIDRNRGASVRRISREEVRDITEVLEDISILMIRKAAKRIDQNGNRGVLEESLAAAQKFRAASPPVVKVTAFMDENARFWGSLALVCGNPVLSDIRLRLQARLFRLAMEGLTVTNNRDKWITHHEEIISALLKGEVGHAVRNARESMSDVWEAILSLPDSAFGR
jgi:DNA-binding GntR family transcriptional regulator